MLDASVSYFKIYKEAVGPESLALQGRMTINQKIADSPLYLAAEDVAREAGYKQELLLPPDQRKDLRASVPKDGSYMIPAAAARLIGITLAEVKDAMEKKHIDWKEFGEFKTRLTNTNSVIAYRQRMREEDRI